MDPRYRFELDEPCCRCQHNQGSDRDAPCILCEWNMGAEGELIVDYFEIIDGDQYAGNVDAYISAVTEGVI